MITLSYFNCTVFAKVVFVNVNCLLQNINCFRYKLSQMTSESTSIVRVWSLFQNIICFRIELSQMTPECIPIPLSWCTCSSTHYALNDVQRKKCFRKASYYRYTWTWKSRSKYLHLVEKASQYRAKILVTKNCFHCRFGKTIRL